MCLISNQSWCKLNTENRWWTHSLFSHTYTHTHRECCWKVKIKINLHLDTYPIIAKLGCLLATVTKATRFSAPVNKKRGKQTTQTMIQNTIKDPTSGRPSTAQSYTHPQDKLDLSLAICGFGAWCKDFNCDFKSVFQFRLGEMMIHGPASFPCMCRNVSWVVHAFKN